MLETPCIESENNLEELNVNINFGKDHHSYLHFKLSCTIIVLAKFRISIQGSVHQLWHGILILKALVEGSSLSEATLESYIRLTQGLNNIILTRYVMLVGMASEISNIQVCGSFKKQRNQGCLG